MIHPDLLGIRTLIFDLDGTLIRSEEVAKRSLREALNDFFGARGESPPELSDGQLMKGIGAPSNEFYTSLLPERYMTDWSEYRDLVFKHELRILNERRITFPAVIGTLREFRRRGYRLALVSNCNRPYLDAVLDSQNLRKHFDIALCIGDFQGASKEELVRLVMEKLGEKAAVIGDRHYDIEAAKKNNIPAIGVIYGYGSREELADTVTCIERPKDLLYLFDTIR